MIAGESRAEAKKGDEIGSHHSHFSFVSCVHNNKGMEI